MCHVSVYVMNMLWICHEYPWMLTLKFWKIWSTNWTFEGVVWNIARYFKWFVPTRSQSHNGQGAWKRDENLHSNFGLFHPLLFGNAQSLETIRCFWSFVNSFSITLRASPTSHLYLSMSSYFFTLHLRKFSITNITSALITFRAECIFLPMSSYQPALTQSSPVQFRRETSSCQQNSTANRPLDPKVHLSCNCYLPNATQTIYIRGQTKHIAMCFFHWCFE